MDMFVSMHMHVLEAAISHMMRDVSFVVLEEIFFPVVIVQPTVKSIRVISVNVVMMVMTAFYTSV